MDWAKKALSIINSLRCNAATKAAAEVAFEIYKRVISLPLKQLAVQFGDKQTKNKTKQKMKKKVVSKEAVGKVTGHFQERHFSYCHKCHDQTGSESTE